LSEPEDHDVDRIGPIESAKAAADHTAKLIARAERALPDEPPTPQAEPAPSKARRAANGHGNPAAQRAPIVRIKTAVEFAREYVPLSYVVEPFVRSRSVYTVTARTGGGKTALLVAIALAVLTKRAEVLGAEVEGGRVAYLAFENPDDVRMKLMIAAFLLNIDLAKIGDRLVILDARAPPEAVFASLLHASRAGAFAVILADTLAAWFDGKDVNDNVQTGEFVRRVRPLTELPGNPSVLVAAHPTKAASDDGLVPYGGGAILNEVDGNLTLTRDAAGAVRLHWQGKLRALDFAPRLFRFEIVGSPDILDAKGRQVQLPVLRPITEADAETRQQEQTDRSSKLLRALIDHPGAAVRQLGEVTQIPKSSVERELTKLIRAKLAEHVLGSWRATAKGRKQVE
jgi:AAA domain